MTATVATTAPAPEAKAQAGSPAGKAAAPSSPDAALFAMMVRADEGAAEPTPAAQPATAKGLAVGGKLAAVKTPDEAKPVQGKPSEAAPDAAGDAEPATEDGAVLAAAQLVVAAQPAPLPAAQTAATVETRAAPAETVQAAPAAPAAPTFDLILPEAAEPAPAETAPAPVAPAASLAAAAPTTATPASPEPAPASGGRAEAAPPPADPATSDPSAAASEPPAPAQAEAAALPPTAPLVEAVAADTAPAAQPLTFKPAPAARAGGAAPSPQASAQPQSAGLFGLAEAAPETAVAVKAVASSGGQDLLGGEAAAETAAPTFELAAGADAAHADAAQDLAPIAQPQAAAAGTTAQPSAVAATAHAGTVPALAAEIAKKLEAKASRFEVQLDPVGLGQVMVQVKIDASGRLSAALSFENAAAAAQLHARAGELRAQLEQAGFDLSRGGLSFDAGGGLGSGADQGSAFGQAQDSGAAFRGRAFGQARQTLDLADVAATPRRTGASGLDLRI